MILCHTPHLLRFHTRFHMMPCYTHFSCPTYPEQGQNLEIILDCSFYRRSEEWIGRISVWIPPLFSRLIQIPRVSFQNSTYNSLSPFFVLDWEKRRECWIVIIKETSCCSSSLLVFSCLNCKGTIRSPRWWMVSAKLAEDSVLFFSVVGCTRFLDFWIDAVSWRLIWSFRRNLVIKIDCVCLLSAFLLFTANDKNSSYRG